jgi:hypothetical protein
MDNELYKKGMRTLRSVLGNEHVNKGEANKTDFDTDFQEYISSGMMNEEKAKSFAVSKAMVYNSYLIVCDKNGGARIDKETIEMFNKDLSSNLKF